DPGPLEGVGGVELEGIGEAALEGGTQLWQGAVERAGESQEPPRAGVALAEEPEEGVAGGRLPAQRRVGQAAEVVDEPLSRTVDLIEEKGGVEGDAEGGV